jgi:hypothetical protein
MFYDTRTALKLKHSAKGGDGRIFNAVDAKLLNACVCI